VVQNHLEEITVLQATTVLQMTTNLKTKMFLPAKFLQFSIFTVKHFDIFTETKLFRQMSPIVLISVLVIVQIKEKEFHCVISLPHNVKI
jgi:hypothetical protein